MTSVLTLLDFAGGPDWTETCLDRLGSCTKNQLGRQTDRHLRIHCLCPWDAAGKFPETSWHRLLCVCVAAQAAGRQVRTTTWQKSHWHFRAWGALLFPNQSVNLVVASIRDDALATFFRAAWQAMRSVAPRLTTPGGLATWSTSQPTPTPGGTCFSIHVVAVPTHTDPGWHLVLSTWS